MFDFLFDLPLLVVGPAIIVLLCLFGLIGMIGTRRFVLPRLKVRTEDSEFTGAMLQAVMVFYGLAVALIAVSVWQSYSDASKLVSQEAAAVAALYRDVSLYPEPHRSRLQRDIREYTEFVIHKAWPLQRAGKATAAPPDLVRRLAADVMSIEPANEAQRAIHAETLRALNEAIRAARLRMDSASTRLPAVLWAVILLGAMISLSASFLFRVEDSRLQGILVTLLAAFVGLVIFMIFALDRPFRGELGLSPDPYRVVYDQMMKP